jgi:hypothetical protein
MNTYCAKFVFSMLLLTLFAPTWAQQLKSINFPWVNVSSEDLSAYGEPRIKATAFQVFRLNTAPIRSSLEGITYREGMLNGFIASVSFPYADGTLHQFTAKRNQTMHPTYNSKFPELITLDAYASDGSGAYGKWDITPTGLHAMIFIPGQSTLFIDPMFEGNNEYYIVYRKRDFITDKIIQCDVENFDEAKPSQTNKSMFGTCELRTYRLAVSATAEYTTFHGGTVALAAAAQVVTMNRVNGVYEKDIAITMVIIPNNNSLIYTSAATDPYTNGTPGTMINQNQTNVDAVIGSSNYDIGHVFGTNSGGLAGLGVVCTGGQKARGVTGSGAPIGDPFDIDYVAHEMGHQFGGNHTQNNNCNSVAAARREPGSASTIMGYAGICAPNVQNNSDDYFHGYNLQEISNEILSNGHQCEVITALNNTPPVINSTSGNIVVPISTPFILTANATDVDGDVLSYLWEQMDNEATTQPPVATATGGPNFRSFDPTLDSNRYFPNLSSLASNGPFTWEVLPSVARVMDFRLTVKDNHAVGTCNDYIDLTVTTNASAGPFVVTYPSATGITWVGGSTQTVTWSIANTNVAPINCTDVRILLSVDGGQTYPYVLASTTANDGTESISCPNVSTNTARVMVMSGAQTFFDISNNNFTITCGTTQTPVFNALPVACQNDAAFSLPSTSDNGISGSWTPALNLTTPGTFTYSFNPAANQCANVVSAQLTVQPQVEPVFSNPTSICQNDVFTLPTNAQNGITGTWNPQVNTQQVGSTTVTFTPDAGQCSNSVNQTITVNSIPSNGISQNGITLTAAAISVTYQWIDCSTNQPVVGATNQSFTTTEAVGTYAVIVTANGCSDTSTCISVDQSGLSEGDINFGLIPNPANESVLIQWDTDAVQVIELLDEAGKIVRRVFVPGAAQQVEFPLVHIAAGVYHVRLSGAENVSIKKLIKL